MAGDDRMPFELPCPGVLELPDRNIQFFNLWHDNAPGAGPDDRVVMVSIGGAGARELIDMRPGDTVRIGRVDVTLQRLLDPSTNRWPVVGDVRPAGGP